MTVDLFSSSTELQRVPLPDADVWYSPHLPLGLPPDEIARNLIRDVRWRSEEIVVWGKKYPQPRLVAWHGDAGQRYTYSGITLEPLPWTDLLLGIKSTVEEFAQASFNSVLLNYYRDHRDSMGFHSDDEPELGPKPTIASLSLGSERVLILKHKTRTELKPVRLPLQSGSLLLMKGDTQHHWKHGINKESKACGPRVNLTFRRIFQRPL